MNPLFRHCTVFLLFLWLTGCGGGGLSDATVPVTPTRYEIIDLSERLVNAYDLNNRGDIAGEDRQGKPVLLRGGDTLVYLSGGHHPEITALNEKGQAVGYTLVENEWTWVEPQEATRGRKRRGEQLPGVQRAFLWQEGTVTDLGALVHPFGAAVAGDINDRGEIVGTATIAERRPNSFFPQWRAVIWRDGQLRQLPGINGMETGAGTINNRGQVVGHGFVLSSANVNPPAIGLLWEGDTVRELRTADGRAFSPMSLNDEGIIAGQVVLPGGKSSAALLLSGTGEITDLAALSGRPDLAPPLSVNNRGQAIGGDVWSDTGGPYLFSEGKVYFLQGMIDAGSVWELTSVHKINDNGYILAGGYRKAEGRGASLLLVPVFE